MQVARYREEPACHIFLLDPFNEAISKVLVSSEELLSRAQLASIDTTTTSNNNNKNRTKTNSTLFPASANKKQHQEPMGNTPANRLQRQWWLANTCAGGGKYKTLNKISRPVFRFRDLTRVPGWKPLLVEYSTEGWILCDRQSVEGRQLRVVELQECLSFRNLMEQYGHCLVTDANTPVSSQPKPIICKKLFSFQAVFAYLDPYSIGKKDGRMDIAVQPPSSTAPEGTTKYPMRNNPTWQHMGQNQQGYGVYEIFAPVAPRASLNARILNAVQTQPAGEAFIPALIGIVSTPAFQFKNRDVLKIFREQTEWIIQ